MSPDRITAVDTNGSTGDEVRSPRGQVHSCSGNFLRLSPSTGGSPRKDFVVQRHCFDRRCHLGFDPPRCDGIDLNVVRGELNSHGFGQLNDRSFGGAIGGNKPGPEIRVHAADVNDLSTLAAYHGPGRELRKKKHGIELRLDDAVPVLRFFVQHAAAQRYVAGIIYQDAYSAEFTLDLLKCGFEPGT